MIAQSLYRNVVALDRHQHGKLRLRHDFTDYTPAGTMNSLFVTAVEFADACREYPIVFVRAGKDEKTGDEELAPVAVLGLSQNENLYLEPGGAWRTPYVPAFLRRYPFAMARLEGGRYAVCVDRDWDGFSESEGQPLFGDDGQPTELLKDVQRFVENFEQEAERTRLVCRRLQELGLLQDMRFDATLPDGSKVSADGFLAVNEQALKDLPDAQVLELHRNGILSLLHAQQISMGVMRRLVEWRAERAREAAREQAAPQ